MIRLFSVAASLALLVSGCKDSTGSSRERGVGTYELRTVNGTALPYSEVYRSGDGITIFEGRIALQSDRTLISYSRYEVRVEGTATIHNDTVRGRYEPEATGAVLLYYEPAGLDFGRVSADADTLILDSPQTGRVSVLTRIGG
jgi:hypothetical protein